jgi:hypothetical protein
LLYIFHDFIHIMKDIVTNLWSLYYSIGLVGLEVVESNSTRETHMTHPDLYPTRFVFLKLKLIRSFLNPT